MHGTPLSVGSPQEVIEKTLDLPGGLRRLPAPAVDRRRDGPAAGDGAGAGRAARHRGRARRCARRWRRAARRACRTRRPTPACVRAKYGDAEPRQPRPNPNRGDNLTGHLALPGQRPGARRRPPAGRAERWRAGPASPTRRGRRCSAPRRRSRRELAAADVWDELSPREYGVLYALSNAPDGLRITELAQRRAADPARHLAAGRAARSRRARRARRRPRRRAGLPHPPHRGRRARPARTSACATAATSRRR